MRLLLDTHIWLWSVLEPERLAKRVANELADPANELWLSPISIWEIQILARKNRIDLPTDASSWVPRALKALSLREAGINHEVAQEIGRLEFDHRDPADLFLLATARVFDLTLVTADATLLRAPRVSVLASK
jgi:PIN domain nuclease of toxin-antitoxin system